MKLDLIKKDIKKKAIRNGVIIAVLFIFFIAAGQYSTSMNSKLIALDNQVKTLRGQITQKTKEFEDSKKEIEIYNKISKTKLPSKENYELGRERLQVLLPVIEEKKDIYLFKKLNFSLGEIKPNPMVKNNMFQAYENDITLDMEGATDEYIMSFINNLQNQLPGYISIESITMKRDKDINEKEAELYIADPKEHIVSASVRLNWATLKEIEKDKPASAVDVKAKGK